MTMTYEPFTPAGSGEQRRYDGRRRAGQPEEAPRGQWTAPEGEWAAAPEARWNEPAVDPWGAPPPGHHPTQDHRSGLDQRAEFDQGSGRIHRAGQDQRWAEPVPADPWGEPGHGQWIEETPRQARTDEHWGTPAPVPRQRNTGEQPISPQRRAGEQPAWHAGLDRTGEPEPAPQRSGSAGNRLKPFVLGAVVLLLLVAGWQAYRIEGMSKHNQDLASVLSAERDRTDRLEKELAGVFNPEGVSSGVLPSVFRVRAGSFTGTAFSVGRKASGNQANLITNYHVVAETWTDGGRRVSLERGSTRINATIVKVDKGKDLALLRAAQTIAPLGTSTAQVKPGQQVVVVGAPLGLDDSVTTGVISAYRPNDADGPTIQFDAPINPGNSGGPVVNSSKQVVGVATAKAKDAEGIGLAIPIKTACQTLEVC
ncbi:MAG: trypsin-like peptidase domain-containing protein [Actinomycetota bacterium]|nr:trypsin-like peptidase domain-containing protein [Actinomycetota bacterium]